MSKPKRKVNREELYYHFSDDWIKCEATPEGREQFFEWVSKGKYPDNPTCYFLCLKQGKMLFDITYAGYRDIYGTWEWWGWDSIEKDFKNAGQEWVLPYLFNWSNRYKGVNL